MRRNTKQGGALLPEALVDSRDDLASETGSEETETVRTGSTWDESATEDFEEDPEEEVAPVAEDVEEEAPADEEGNAPDDALGLYLRQMGAIPLLSREQELALAERLELKRGRFRHAAMCNWRTLAKIVDTFERIAAGTLTLDPSIDVVGSLGLTRENILKRMPINVPTLKVLI